MRNKQKKVYFIILNNRIWYSPMFYQKEDADKYIQTFIEHNLKALEWATGTKYEKRYKKELDKYTRAKVSEYSLMKLQTYD